MAKKHVTYSGPHTLDMTPLEGKLIDIQEGGLQGLRGDLPDFPTVVAHLARAVPNHGAAAGIPQDVYEHFLECNQAVALIDTLIGLAAKQLEVLKESRAYYVDARQGDLCMMVDCIKSRAQRRRDHALLAPFADLLKYNSQIAEKARRTRLKRSAAKTEPAPATPATPPKRSPATKPPPTPE